MIHRDIKIRATPAEKKVRFYVDGVLKFAYVHECAEHALVAAEALAKQYAHHNPVVTIDIGEGLL